MRRTPAVQTALSTIVAIGTLSAVLLQPATAQETSIVDTRDAVESADWADNVTITFDDSAKTFNFKSNGIPDHGFADKYLIPIDVDSMPFADNAPEEFNVVKSAEYFTETDVDTDITTLPIYSETTTDTSLGRIGVALSGAQLFNDYEDPTRSVVAMDDNVIHDHVPFVDECNGHTLVDGTSYHYHGIPVCLTVRLDVESTHSYMLGVLEDGFPVYDNQDANGEEIGSDGLDECSGHVEPTPEFPDGTYHYHLTADEAPYMIDCYHGEIDEASASGGAANPEDGGPNLSEAATALGVSVDSLREALGGGGPPDFEGAAEKLGINVDDLMEVMPLPPQ